MSEVVRPDDMRRQNQTKVLASLRTRGNLSRTAIGEETRLSAATISAITADLLKQGVLLHREEEDASTSLRGRPRVALGFDPDFACVGTIVLQLNEIVVSIVDYCGNPIVENVVKLSTTTLPSLELLSGITNALEAGLQQSNATCEGLKQITLGVQGTTDVENTMLLWSPITPHKRIPMQAWLGEHFGVPVSVHNDCNMIARALRHREPDTYNSDFAAILLSHGIGMGLYHNGELVKGKYSSATEFGHMVHVPDGALCRCGRSGCIEAYAGDYAIYRRAQAISTSTPPRDDVERPEMEEIISKAAKGDLDAIAAFKEAGLAIGGGLASLFALLDRFPVALVGAGTRGRDHIANAVMQAIGQSPTDLDSNDPSIRYYLDEGPLISEGCAITALMEVDHGIVAGRAGRKDKVVRIAG